MTNILHKGDGIKGYHNSYGSSSVHKHFFRVASPFSGPTLWDSIFFYHFSDFLAQSQRRIIQKLAYEKKRKPIIIRKINADSS